MRVDADVVRVSALREHHCSSVRVLRLPFVLELSNLDVAGLADCVDSGVSDVDEFLVRFSTTHGLVLISRVHRVGASFAAIRLLQSVLVGSEPSEAFLSATPEFFLLEDFAREVALNTFLRVILE